MTIQKLIDKLTLAIEAAYEEGITIPEAEKLASEFLFAQIQISEALKHSDLNARMKKSGVKAVKAAVYTAGVKSADKKPSDTFLQNMVDMDQLVVNEQNGLDIAETERDALERYYSIFQNAHIHFRGIAKGKFGD